MAASSPVLSLVFTLSILLPAASKPTAANPFSPKASLLRHWARLFPSGSGATVPPFLLAKSSPLTAAQLAAFSGYIDSHTLAAHLPSFCSAAALFCDLKPPSPANLTTRDPAADSDFESYSNRQFQRYRRGGTFGGDTFKNYSVGENVAHDSFGWYGREGDGRSERFANYAVNTNVAGSRFRNYGDEGNAGDSTFTEYSAAISNVQGQDFQTYDKDSSGNIARFTSYSEVSNVIKNEFRSYGVNANAEVRDFVNYAGQSNIGTNKFSTYDAAANGAIGSFTNYANLSNVARNEFDNYDADANTGTEEFNNYAVQITTPRNVFKSYGQGTNSPTQRFTSYGNSSSPSKSEFIDYNKAASGSPRATFANYVGGPNATDFKKYFQTDVTFTDYQNSSSSSAALSSSSSSSVVEPGKFFRQATLSAGNEIPFPDIRDKMPKRSFLPRRLADKLPFSSSQLPDLARVLGMERMEQTMARTIAECERPPARDETKRCATSIEGMAEFAAQLLGQSAGVSATEGTEGWGETLVVGEVRPRNGGKETTSVSCHQSLFPYLVYYCHMVPRVMVYDVELRRPTKGKQAVNRAVAICHLDTSAWSPGHAAFAALGPAPGKIEVCHFIFENDMVWVARG